MLNDDEKLDKTVNQEDQSQSEHSNPFTTPTTNKVANLKSNLTSNRSKPFTIPPISKIFKKNPGEVETSGRNRSSPSLKISIAKKNVKTPNKIIVKPSEKMDIETNPDDLEDVSEKSRTINQPLVKIKPLKQKKTEEESSYKNQQRVASF